MGDSIRDPFFGVESAIAAAAAVSPAGGIFFLFREMWSTGKVNCGNCVGIFLSLLFPPKNITPNLLVFSGREKRALQDIFFQEMPRK